MKNSLWSNFWVSGKSWALKYICFSRFLQGHGLRPWQYIFSKKRPDLFCFLTGKKTTTKVLGLFCSFLQGHGKISEVTLSFLCEIGYVWSGLRGGKEKQPYLKWNLLYVPLWLATVATDHALMLYEESFHLCQLQFVKHPTFSSNSVLYLYKKMSFIPKGIYFHSIILLQIFVNIFLLRRAIKNSRDSFCTFYRIWDV